MVVRASAAGRLTHLNGAFHRINTGARRRAVALLRATENGDGDTVDSLEAITASESSSSSSPYSVARPENATGTPAIELQQRDVNKFASTFAPRASGSTARPNPAYKGSWLYTVFDVQAWLALVVGGLLSFNVIFPSDQPDIARLMGMWSIWMFTIPPLRARECTQKEKDALNILFLLVPLANVALPFVWKNFGFIFSADVLLLFGVFQWKGYWEQDEQEEEGRPS